MRARTESVLGVGVLLGAIAACHKDPAATDASPLAVQASTELSVDAGPSVAFGPRIAPSRCHPAEPAITLGTLNTGAAAELELGDAVELPGGYAVSLLHRTARGLTAAVGIVGGGGAGNAGGANGANGANGAQASANVIDLGPTLGDAPPPRIMLVGSDLIVGAYSIVEDAAEKGGAKGRRLSLYDVAGLTAKPILDVAQQRDDSLAFDVALAGPTQATAATQAGQGSRPSAIVVWDEASRAGHGVIRAALAPLNDRSPSGAPSPAAPSEGSAHDVSPPDSDAEMPRVVTFGPASIALWIARKPEPGIVTDAAEVEATGEVRSFGWLEAVALDERGLPAGPVRKLTPVSGHVSTYDVRTLPSAQRPTLLIVARDDGEAVDASGGELLRVRIVGDGVEPPVAFPSDGLGRGGPALVDGQAPWLTWIGPHEQLRLLPLDAEGAPLAKPSAEDEMSDSRPLLSLRQPRQSLLVASPLDPKAPLRVFVCSL